MIATLAISLALVFPQWVPSDPEPEPTADETLGLEWVNRFRADPAGEGALLMEREFPREAFAGFDREMYLAEIAELEPAPPVFFHTRLIAAARNHANYTVLNSANKEYGHREIDGHAGFTGEWAFQRAAAAGYPKEHGRVGESTVAYCRGGIYGNHWGNIVDDGPGGEGGMQKGRGHRALTINPRYREFGMGNVIRKDGRQDLAQVYGEGSGARLIGGVAFLDLDGDGFYDVGEGVGQMTIQYGVGYKPILPGNRRTCGFGKWPVDPALPVHSWTSDAYVLSAKSNKATSIKATYFDLILEEEVPTSDANFKVDFELSERLQAKLRILTRQLNFKTQRKVRRAQEDLAFWTHRFPALEPPSPLPEEVLSLQALWDSASQAALDKLTRGEPLDPKYTPEFKVNKNSNMGKWFQDAQALSGIMRKRQSLQASKGSASTKERKRKALSKEAFLWFLTLQNPDLHKSALQELGRIGRLAEPE